jgi:hypothetical protein
MPDVLKILDKFASAFPFVSVLIVYLFLSGTDVVTIEPSQKEIFGLWPNIALIIFSYLLGIILEILAFAIIKLGLFKKHIANVKTSDIPIVHDAFSKFLSLELGFIAGLILNNCVLQNHAFFVFFNLFFLIMLTTFLIVLLLYYFVTKS